MQWFIVDFNINFPIYSDSLSSNYNMKTYLIITLICSIVICTADAVLRRHERDTTTTEDPNTAESIKALLAAGGPTENDSRSGEDEDEGETTESSTECTCTKYHQCDRGADSTLIIDPRSSPKQCSQYEVCCPENAITSPSDSPELRVDANGTSVTYKGCGIRNVNGIDIRLADGEIVSTFQLVLMN